MRIFSGIRASGDKTLGNYSGGFRQYAATQEQGDAFFCIVDLHSITTPYEPEELRQNTLSLAAMLFATGLDPERSTVFAQSHVKAQTLFTGETEDLATVCSTCGKPSGSGKFCQNCGAPLGYRECPNCHHKNPQTVAFCGECGKQL